MTRLGRASGLRFIVIDEVSFLSQSHFSAISRRCQQATGNFDRPFGDFNVVLVGDLRQHDPPKSTPLVCRRAGAASVPDPETDDDDEPSSEHAKRSNKRAAAARLAAARHARSRRVRVVRHGH
jgi:hypothetical protein